MWAVPAVAVLMLGLTLIPAEIWQAPASDASYKGFDPNLVYTPPADSSLVKVAPASVDITAPPGSFPRVILATTPLQKFATAIDVTVQQNENANTPFRLGLWSPWTDVGFFVVFKPDNTIVAETIVKGFGTVTLQGGDVIGRGDLGTYQLGTPYRVEFVLNKAGGSLTSRVSSAGTTPVSASVNSQQSPKLFGDVALSLSASVEAGTGSSRTVLQGFTVEFPHQRLWASKIADPRAEVLLVGLAIAGVLLVAIAITRQFRAGLRPALGIRRPHLGWRGIALIAGSVIAYFVGNALLFPLASHPFDMLAEQLYAYVARTYGISQLYFLPNVVSMPKAYQGVPLQELPFPYEPVFAYLSAGIGWLNSLLVGGGTFALDTHQLEYVIKSVNVLFGFGDGVLIYVILRQIGASNRWSLVAAALWLFNPAVWFSMSIWGQTHVISLFFVLVAVLMAEKRYPPWAWLALTAAILTRPQMLIFGLLLGTVLLRKFTWKENVTALSWTVIITFVALVPLTLATSPSLPVDIMINTFKSHETGAPSLQPIVGQDAYSVWPLVEYWTQGATGFHAVFNPNNGVILGPLTFQRLSQILTLLAALIVSGFLWFRRGATDEPGGYLPYLALGVTAFLMLLFGLIATHFLLALPLLVLIRRWTGTTAYVYVLVIWTLTTFVTMYGDMGLILSSHDYPLLAASNNSVTKFVVWLYTTDRFITAGIVANICAVLWLGYLTLQPSSPHGTVRATEAR